jgi:transposase
MGNCAGVDWASEKHDLLIENPAGEELLAATFSHTEAGIAGLCRALVRHEVGLVAIERPDGLLVDRILDAGVRILPLHPNQVAASRDRFRASGGKSDRFDRFVLCELARTDAHRFRVLEPESDETKALRALTRARKDLVTARVAMSNQLRAELDRFWPGPVRMFSAIDTPVSLAFLAKYPSPSDAKALGVKRLTAFLKAHGSSKATAAAELLGRLRDAPSGRVGQAEAARRRTIVLSLVSALSVMVEQINRLETEIADALDAHPDGPVFRSFFVSQSAVLCPATLLAEIGDSRGRYPHRDAIAAQAGHAPVADESGKRKNAKFRWACNHRLRNALSTLAQSIRRWNPWAADLYNAARARGHNHRRALRTLGRSLARIIWKCWQTRTPYNPDRHPALQRHITVTIPDPSGPRPDLPATQRMAGAAVTQRAVRRAERASA